LLVPPPKKTRLPEVVAVRPLATEIVAVVHFSLV
jgi:hypothetical protein